MVGNKINAQNQLYFCILKQGLPWWHSLQYRRSGFDPWVGKIPWRRAWQPTVVFLPGESHGQRSLVGYRPWGLKESDKTERLSTARTETNMSPFKLPPRKVISSVQSLSCVWLFVTPWTVACQASLSITNSESLLKLMSTESVMSSNHIILCPLLLLPSIFPSIRVFSNESVLHTRWPKYWNFSFSISPSNEYSGLISFRIDWLDLLAVQGTLKSLLQHHNSKPSILWCSAFFIV